jgi:cytochrome b involved in lipid metabolism
VASVCSHLFTFSFRLSTGQDATEAFEDVGHSDEARALLPGMLVGDLEQDTVSDHTAFYNHHCHTNRLPLTFRASS